MEAIKSIPSYSTHTTQNIITLGAILLTLALIFSGGAIMTARANAGSPASKNLSSKNTDIRVNNTQTTMSGNAFHTGKQPARPADNQSRSATPNVASPSVSDQNTSSTTITVNGQTTHVSGGDSLNKILYI